VEQLRRYIDSIKYVTLFDGSIRIQGDVGLISYAWYKENDGSDVFERMIRDMTGVGKIIFDIYPNEVYVWDEGIGMYVLMYGSNPNPKLVDVSWD